MLTARVINANQELLTEISSTQAARLLEAGVASVDKLYPYTIKVLPQSYAFAQNIVQHSPLTSSGAMEEMLSEDYAHVE